MGLGHPFIHYVRSGGYIHRLGYEGVSQCPSLHLIDMLITEVEGGVQSHDIVKGGCTQSDLEKGMLWCHLATHRFSQVVDHDYLFQQRLPAKGG